MEGPVIEIVHHEVACPDADDTKFPLIYVQTRFIWS